jgi:6,7-dimethyl-8-ribityllumazine synthase
MTKLPHNKRIAFIRAGWHADIIDRGRESFLAEMEKAGVGRGGIDLFEVPGSLEIPLQAQMLAKTGRYAVIVCGGFIVNGGIYRHEFVCSAVIDGIMRVMLDTGVPILSMILTPQNFHESETHHKFFFDHFVIKGKEAAEACLKTLENLQQFDRTAKAA